LVIAVVIAAGYAWTYWPPGANTKSDVQRSIVGYELAPAPIWPAKYYSLTAMTPQFAAAMRAGYTRRVRDYATEPILTRLLRRHVAGSLKDVLGGDGRFEVVGTGRIIYYQFRLRRPNGDLVVRAAVQHTFTTGRWNARARSLEVDPAVAVPQAIIYDYTVRRVDGRWKVARAVGWRFLDVPSGRVTYDPPSSWPYAQP
jgi:hypothetical protein